MNPSFTNVGPGATSPVPLPPSTMSDETTRSHLQRLSLSTASGTALPSSPQVASPNKTHAPRNYPSSPSGKGTPRSPLPRSPSAMSLDARSSTPTSLHRKASINSLHGVGGVTPPRSSSSRRSSSAQFVNGHPGLVMGKSPLSSIEDPPCAPLPPTAASIASSHFRTELDVHNQDVEGRPADTIIILHDSCYGHRYSRPRTSRAGLSTIVERPERIHASILGLSVAYVRLGQRHAEGNYPIHPKRDVSKIPSIPFRIRKTTRKLPLSSPAVTNVHGTKWMEELKIMCDGAEAKLALTGKELTRPEMSRSPDQEPPPKLHEGDLYLCSESLDAMEGALGAVCEGVDAVFQGSTSGTGPYRAFINIRPPGHHCSASYPSGFCWLNNVHVGIAHAALNHGLTHAAIIDFDLHHGDGSQAITWEHNKRSQGASKNAPSWKKTSIGYFSLHDINSYPCEMGDEEKVKNASLCIDNAHGQSIWNVHLQPWKNEHEFWHLYESRYAVLLEKTRLYLRTQTQRLRSSPNQPQARAAIFLSAGFDASEWESSGMQRHKVNVPTEFYARLTRDVVKLAAEEDCAVHGRVISVLEGGYSDRALSSGVLSHISGLAGGDSIMIKNEPQANGLGYEMAQKFSVLNGTKDATNGSMGEPVQPYDSMWWALHQLEHLDTIVNPPAPPAEPKRSKDTAPPTYSSPTQSFTAKIVSAPKMRRSSSSLSNLNGGSSRPVSRAPSPPPPEVTWATAAHELSKLLIPTNRQTMSCKPEELSAEASRARRDRQSILTPPASAEPTVLNALPSTRMALRERKAAKPLSTAEEDEETDKPVSRAGRRKTVAGGAVLAAEKAMARSTTPKPEPSFNQPAKQSSRRLSLVSSTGSTTSQAPALQASNGHNRVPSVGPTAVPPRPGSSQNMRPGSSMSSKGPGILPVVVKKTRTVNSTCSDAPKNPRVNRKSPTADASKAGPGNNGTQKPPVLHRAASSSARSTSISNPAVEGIDAITTGMKKVTITLLTKAQREAREQAKIAAQAATSSASAPTSFSAVAARPVDQPSKSTPATHSQPPTQVPIATESKVLLPPASRLDSFSTSSAPTTPNPLPSSRLANFTHPSTVPLPASSPPSATTPTHNHPSSSNVFVPYQPEGPAPAPLARQEPLRWLPPNTSTPVGMKRGDLPVFSAEGVIPFAAAGRTSGGGMGGMGVQSEKQTQKKDEKEVSIWDVPETPAR